VKKSLNEGHYNEALAICDQNTSPFSTLLKIGIENRHQPEMVQRDILKDAASLEAPKLESGLSLLGTIIGIERSWALRDSHWNNESLWCLEHFRCGERPNCLGLRCFGGADHNCRRLVVAIPCTIFYNYFVNRVNAILIRLESQVNSLVLLINSANGKAKDDDPEEV